ncbi:sugar ABC transporter substrate-binding protein, partial [Planctomycetota bacterium]
HDVHLFYIVFTNFFRIEPKLIKSGSILCTIDQHADQLAVFGIEYALEMLANNNSPDDQETPVDLITAETIK